MVSVGSSTWIGGSASACMVAWWFDGVLQSLTLLNLPAGDARAPALREAQPLAEVRAAERDRPAVALKQQADDAVGVHDRTHPLARPVAVVAALDAARCDEQDFARGIAFAEEYLAII